jgi:hypothetical protein
MAEGLSPLPLFQPFLRVRKPVRKQRNTAQPEDSRISLGILVGHSHVDFTSFGKLPNLEPPIGRINFGWKVASPEKLHGATISAVSFFLSFATFRMRSSACDTLTRLCARLLRARPERQRDHRAAKQ